jgi:catechol 2,3-dioxygenase-like lactoylglutathione lyase family enzyme
MPRRGAAPMPSEIGLDHIVIVVADLDRGIDDYRALGFTVVRGGEHSGAPSHNALVGLADGTYLELIAFRGPVDGAAAGDAPSPFWAMVRSWGRLPEGLAHFALLPGDTAAVIASAAARGVALEGPFGGSRLRPDGTLVAWQTGIPEGLSMPFLCGDVTARELRVPGGESAVHANGAVGIDGVVVACADLAEASARYAALLGVPSDPTLAAQLPGASTTAFALRGGTLTLAAPCGRGAAGTSATVALAAHLAERGPSLFALRLGVAPGAETGALDAELGHGARIERVDR